MSHFTNLSTCATSTRGHGFEFGGKHGSIERQGDVGWGVQREDQRPKMVKVKGTLCTFEEVKS